MKKLCAAMLVALLLTFTISQFSATAKEYRSLRENVLRLHILANSDSQEDQRLKLSVRDALLAQPLFCTATSEQDAQTAAQENLPQIIAVAQKTLRDQGCFDPVSAVICTMHFDDRVYNDLTMPAGMYHAVRILIGEGKGKNWWCVLYPPLCLPVAEKEEKEQMFSDRQMDLLQNPKKYQVRLAVVEWWTALFSDRSRP